MSALTVVSDFLTDSQKQKVVLDLISELNYGPGDAEKIQVLASLLGAPQFGSVKPLAYEIVKKYCEKLLETTSEDGNELSNDNVSVVETILMFGDIFSALHDYLLTVITAKLVSFLKESESVPEKIWDLPPIMAIFSSETPSSTIQRPRLAILIKILDAILSKITAISKEKTGVIISLACCLITIVDEEIPQLGLKLTRWSCSGLVVLDPSLQSVVWSTIYYLCDLKRNTVKTGCIFWIRFLYGKTEQLQLSSTFQKEVTQTNYWSTLQKLLVHPLHEYRKYALTIVQLSVESIGESFDNAFMKWDTTQREEYILEWKRFCTVYEIIGIDTSLHQVEAATSDIHSLLNSKVSKLKTSWGLCLISTALQASMDSVKKIGLSTLFGIPLENLSVFDETSRYFLQEVFLKFGMQASLFSVEENQKIIDKQPSCPYGDQLISFIQNVFTSLKKSKGAVAAVVSAILGRLFDDREAYDFARVYVLTGLHKGLKTSVIGEEHLEALKILFHTSCETNLCEMFVQKMYLRLLRFVDCKKVSFASFLTTVASFVTANNGKNNTENYGYLILNDESELLVDFLFTHYPQEALLDTLVNTKLTAQETSIGLHFLLTQHPHADEDLMRKIEVLILNSPDFPVLLLELTFSGLSNLDPLYAYLQKYYSTLAQELSNNQIRHPQIWLNSPSMILPELFDQNDETVWADINLERLWQLVFEEFQSPVKAVVQLAISKLRFFAKLYSQMKFLDKDSVWTLSSIGDIIELSQSLFANLNSRNLDYKYFDQTYDSLFSILKDYLSTELITPQLRSKAMDLIKSGLKFAQFKTQMSVLTLIQEIFFDEASAEDVASIVSVLSIIWDSITAGKLKLNQTKLYITFIDTLLNKRILSLCITSPEVLFTVNTITLEMITLSPGRRSLVPRIACKIRQYQLSNPSEFAGTDVFAMLLVELYLHEKSTVKAFKLIPIVARLYTKIIDYGTGDSYSRFYGIPENSGKVLVVAMLASLENNSILGQRLFSELIAKYQSKFTSPSKLPTKEETLRINIYTLLLILICRLDNSSVADVVERNILPALSIEPSPLVRVYIEWIVGVIYSCDLDKVEQLFKLISSDPRFNPFLVMAYQRISFLICRELDLEAESKYLRKFLTILIGYCASDKAVLRHFSCSLMCCVKKELDLKPDLQISEEEKAIVDRIYQQVTLKGKIKEYRYGDAMLWNLTKDLTLVSICGGALMKVSDRSNMVVLTRTDFTNVLRSTASLKIPVGYDEKDIWLGSRTTRIKTLDLPSESTPEMDMVALQKKSGGWRSVMDLEDDTKVKTIKRSELIVMGSLVDKPPNLGGIVRLCDVLGAGLLTIGDDNYKSNNAFKSVAVTADLWLPMMEVKPENIIEYIRFQKSEGYTLIGLEQTDKSVELNYDLKFPSKSLIVLGKEKQGIPGDILAELDLTVEIRQVGMIRSMNIQTATALIVHAYSLQHC